MEKEYFILDRDKHGREWVVCSEHVANESRFIAGTPSNLSVRANCIAKRLLVDDIPRIFISTTKDIKPGEVFYIDYGDSFPTPNFLFIKSDSHFLKHLEEPFCIK